MERKNYDAPGIEVLDVAAERGFEASTVTGQVEDFEREDWNE